MSSSGDTCVAGSLLAEIIALVCGLTLSAKAGGGSVGALLIQNPGDVRGPDSREPRVRDGSRDLGPTDDFGSVRRGPRGRARHARI